MPILAPVKRILLQFLLLLFCYFLMRCAFTLVNLKHFPGLHFGAFLNICLHGLRYDISAIAALNLPYALMLLLPLPVWRWRGWLAASQIVFIFVNGVSFLFELTDWVYFPYNFHRSTGEVLRIMGRKSDFASLLPEFIVLYWYLIVAWIVLLVILIRGNRMIRLRTPVIAPVRPYSWTFFSLQVVRLAVYAGLSVIAIRGGLQYIPIGLRTAMEVTDSRFVPLVINTPFSVMTTIGEPTLDEIHYMSDTAAAQQMQFVKQYNSRPFRPKNVVVIIIESLSKEFTRLGNGPSYTPFLDSLMNHSLVCTQAYANALHSAEGIPAVLSGVPSMMDDPVIDSKYGTNNITALAGVLKGEGYSTAFYHGGANGTMSFDAFAAAAGYAHYYGRNEYHNDKDYDGAWGISDEPFLQYFARGLNTMQQPFMASVFTLTSHQPYVVPAARAGQFPKGTIPIHAVVGYTDFALREFFKTASKQPWYNNTLFVFSADHCSPLNTGGYYESAMGRYAIPIFFYAPGDSAINGNYDRPMQQIDIVPSVLDYLGYSKPFFAFGNSIFQPGGPHYVLNNLSDSYQWLENGYVLQSADSVPKGLYRFPADSGCVHNLLPQMPAQSAASLLRLKAFIQLFREAMIRNRMHV